MLKPTKILTSTQRTFLSLLGKSKHSSHFTLSGGTALCGFFIPYRYSEDLDFFSKEEFDIQQVVVWIKSIKKTIAYTSFDIQTAFNRNLIFLNFNKKQLKTEFTYFPFPSKNTQKYMDISVDSLEDIALNKLFALYQQPRLRDYMDFYMITKTDEYKLDQLRVNAKTKFDWDIDPIQLGSQFLRVTEFQDKPNTIGTFPYKQMEQFFRNSATSLSSEILS